MKKIYNIEQVAINRINEIYGDGLPLLGGKTYNDSPLWITDGLLPYELMVKNDPVFAREVLYEEINVLIEEFMENRDFSELDSASVEKMRVSLEEHGGKEVAREYIKYSIKRNTLLRT